MADRFAAAGFYVLVPNLFYRAGKYAPFDMKTAWGNPAEKERLMAVLKTAQPEPTLRDLGIYIDTLQRTPGVKPGPMGCVGYCLGGMLTFRAAAAYPDQIAAGASIHGGGLVTDKPDSPHLGAPKIKARMYFSTADEDPTCTAEHRQTLEAALKAAHVRYTLDFNPGVRHGFAPPDTAAHNPAASERHFEKTIALFREALA
jgi:carboxymethylenebutenolidase